MKQYVTFGQTHRHEVDGIHLDKNTVAVFEAADAVSGREKAFDAFGRKFCFHYPDQFPDDAIGYFPSGFVVVPL